MPISGGSSGGAKAGDVRAGGAFVEIFGDDSKLQKTLDGVRGRIQGFGKIITRAGIGTAAAGGAMFAPIAAATKEAVDHINEIGGLQRKFGGSAESMSRLAYAFKSVGVETEELDHLMKHLAKTASEEASGDGNMFKQLGIDALAFMKLSPEEQFAKLQDALSRVPLEADRINASMKLMGKSGDQALKLLGLGVDDYNAKLRKADEDGYVYTQEQLNQAKSISRAMKDLKANVTSAFLAIGEAILPQHGILEAYLGILKRGYQEARGWIDEHKEIFQIVAGVGAALIGTGTALIGIGKGISLIGSAIGGLLIPLRTVASLGASLLSFLLSPIGLITAAIGGLTAVWITQTESGQKFAKDVKDGFLDVAETAKEAWGGIVGALAKGDLQLAAQIALKGVKVVWLQFVVYLTKIWNSFKEVFLDSWRHITTVIANTLSSDLLSGPMAHAFDALGWIAEKLGSEQDAKLNRNAAAELRRDPRAVRGQIIEGHIEVKNAAAAARESDVQAAMDDLAAARKELAELANRGKVPKAGATLDPIEQESKKALDRMAARAAESVKGAFQSPNWAMQFGYADTVAQRQIQKLEEVKAAVAGAGAGMIAAIKGLKPIGFK